MSGVVDMGALTAVAARAGAEGWRVKAPRIDRGAVDIVDARGNYVAVGVPADLARAALAIPGAVAVLGTEGKGRDGR